jgi:hypothetical protein
VTIKGKLDKAVRKDRDFSLKEIFSYCLESVSSLKRELDMLNVVTKTYTIDAKKHEGILYKEKFVDSLNIGIFNQDLWLADSLAPYVAAIPFDVEDSKSLSISAYNYAGGVIIELASAWREDMSVISQIICRSLWRHRSSGAMGRTARAPGLSSGSAPLSNGIFNLQD